MATKTRPAKQDRWASQAAQAALLRYQPQRQALKQLVAEAHENYSGAVEGADSAARLSSSAVRQAEPQVSSIYDRAAATSSSSNANLMAALSSLGSGASGYKIAAQAASSAGSERLARERAAAEGSLRQQDVSANSAPSYARTLAGEQLLKTLGKLSSQSQSIAASEGDAAATERSKLEDQAEGRRVTERGQNLTAQSSAAARGQKAKEHQEDLADKRQSRREKGETAGGVKPLSLKENDEGAATIRQIRQYASEAGSNRAERVAALTEGQPSQSTETSDGKKVRTPEIPALKPDVLMSAALDWAEYGHLTRNTEHRLSQEGYNVQRLGIPRASGAGETARQTGKKIKQAIGF